MNEKPFLSVIIPVRNEENYVERCVESILMQTYPKDCMEVLFVDGMSEDNTRKMIAGYQEKHPGLFQMIENPKKITPVAMNLGITQANGVYIIRLDAHSSYEKDYLMQCVETLRQTGADNAGGLALTKGTGTWGAVFAEVLSSKFGVGNSGFRTNASSGYTDTVPFGAFPRETFETYGMYDERLVRNQDYELNDRIRKHGGKIYLNADIVLCYYCRNTLAGIFRQSFDNGKWNVITMKLCSGSMGIRHFIPLFFVLSLVLLPICAIVLHPFFWMLFSAEAACYLLLALYFLRDGTAQKKTVGHYLKKFLLFPFFHISYGLGSVAGIGSAMKR